MIDPKSVPSFMLNDGCTIPCIGMGTFGSDRVTPDEVAAAVAGGLRAGYRLFDCAACYGTGDKFESRFPDVTLSDGANLQPYVFHRELAVLRVIYIGISRCEFGQFLKTVIRINMDLPAVIEVL